MALPAMASAIYTLDTQKSGANQIQMQSWSTLVFQAYIFRVHSHDSVQTQLKERQGSFRIFCVFP